MTDPRPITTFPPDAILDVAHVAQMLGVSVRTVQSLDLRYHRVGTFRKYICREVLEDIEKMKGAA